MGIMPLELFLHLLFATLPSICLVRYLAKDTDKGSLRKKHKINIEKERVRKKHKINKDKGRVRKNVNGVVFNCLCTAIYLDLMEGYDANYFLVTLRYTSVYNFQNHCTQME